MALLPEYPTRKMGREIFDGFYVVFRGGPARLDFLCPSSRNTEENGGKGAKRSRPPAEITAPL
jgi:hypothetical protein